MDDISVKRGRNSEQKKVEGSDFESAISATKFGWYNYGVIGIGCFWNLITVVEVTTFSFILPTLQCDWALDTNRMGLLNSIIFLGMICGSVLWGFLADILGRRNLLSCCILALGFINIALGFSNNFAMLMLFKFFSGFINSGPMSIIISYMSEMHGVRYRVRILVFIAIFYGGGNFATSLLGLIFLSRPLEVHFRGVTLHSWQLLLLTVAVLDFVGGTLACLLPESPKFLMSRGRCEEALRVLQTIYRRNTGKHADTYPVSDSGVSMQKNGLMRAFTQIAPMLKPPYVTKCLLAFGIELFLLLGMNSMRLWMPQVFAFMGDGESDSDFDICTKIQSNDVRRGNATDSDECSASRVLSEGIFFNAMIVQSVGIVGTILICIFIKTIHNKLMLVCSTLIGAIASIAIYFSVSPLMVVIMYSLTVGLSLSSQAAFSSILSNIVPTAFRSTVISISLSCGRLGSMLGTYLFPQLMAQGCWPPFVAIGVVFFACAMLCMCLPRSTRKTLL
ncbi:synaptic vesicle glycoprotein 2B-like [Phlebotomus argentipes]|uniref:synaptic vesicle glycoprotein 2B-like n=1 Tax=Phlebotomus argentipes TaxID=94469 RepID=UPI002892B422|nr:synaptic vesicle glycoprotein 2B-like [Phlebotomus argentipes]